MNETKNNNNSGTISEHLRELPVRLIGIVLAPRRTLSHVIDENGYWLPILFVIVALTGLKLTMLPEVYEYYSTTEFHDWYKDVRGVGDEIAIRDIERMISSAPFLVFIEAPLTIILGTAGIAMLLLIVGRFGFSQRTAYRRVFSMVAWASVISGFPMLLNIPLKLINHRLFLPTNLTLILTPELVGEFFSSFISIVDLFLVWQVWLLSIGLTLLYEISIQRAVSSIGTMFVCFGILNALFA